MDLMSFANLSDAVEFLAAKLDSGDVDTIADQCADAVRDPSNMTPREESPRSYRLAAIRELQKQHRVRSLRSTYAGREFPSDAGEFKLGGHQSEVGHVHIDFVRNGAVWRIKAIWECE